MNWKTPNEPLKILLSNGKSCRITEQGIVTFLLPIENGAVVQNSISISELLFIVQEYQEHCGGTIPVQVNLSEWRGLYGTPRDT